MMANQEYILGKIGDIKIGMTTNPPSGFLSLGEGSLLNRSEYADFWSWVESNCHVIPESEWQEQITEYGTCAYFSSGDESTTFRLPKINSIIKFTGTENIGEYTPANYTDLHYHGLGKYQNNNGNWGRLSYTGAKYPEGTTGWFWNGSGGAATSAGPDTTGDIITSFNISDSKIDITPASTNLCLYIRYTEEYQETASNPASLDKAYKAIDDLYTQIDSIANAYNLSNSLDTTGWQVYSSNLIEEWGRTLPGEINGTITYPLTLSEGNTPFNIDWTLIDPSSKSTGVNVKFLEISNTSMKYVCEGNLASDAYIMWAIKASR